MCIYLYIRTVMNTTILQLVAIYNTIYNYILYYIILYYIILYYIILYYIILYHTISYHTIPHHISYHILYYIKLYYTIPHYIILYYIATNCNIVVFVTVCIYRYIHTTALYYQNTCFMPIELFRISRCLWDMWKKLYSQTGHRWQ